MTKLPFLVLTIAFVAIACSGDGEDNNSAADASAARPDASSAIDAAPKPDATSTVDAMPPDLSDHGFVTVDGTQIVFDSTSTYTNSEGSSDVTINGDVGADCPFGDDCTTLYVSVPGNASLGPHTCDELEVSVQLNIDRERYFSFGSVAAFCSFTLSDFGTEPGGQVAVTNLSARLEAYLSPDKTRTLSNGELRATSF